MFDVEKLTAGLNATLFGQEEAIKRLLSLARRANERGYGIQLPAAFIWGDVGTGKSHAVDYLKRTFFDPHRVFQAPSSPETAPPDRCPSPALLVMEDLRLTPHNFSSLSMNRALQNWSTEPYNIFILVVTVPWQGSINFTSPRPNNPPLPLIKRHLLDKMEKSTYHALESLLTSHHTIWVPFLPLNREHLMQCIRAKAEERGVALSPAEVRWILNETEFVRPSLPLFSRDGCARVAERVRAVMAERKHFLGIA